MRVLHRLLAFNRGIISRLALARHDIARVSLSAETMTNWMPRLLGSMMLRPGSRYKFRTKSDAKALWMPFVFSTDDTALLEFTQDYLRVAVDDTIITRPTITTAVTNGNFSASTDWTDADESGAVSTVGSGVMVLTGSNGASAIRQQQVTRVGSAQEHAVTVVVLNGTVRLKIGYTAEATVGDSLYGTYMLGAGTHSISFTAPTSFYLILSSSTDYPSRVSSITLSTGGDLVLPTPWQEEDLPYLRWVQSGDVVYVACRGYAPRQITRYGTRSWGISTYLSTGPYRGLNTSPITLTPSALTGEITLTASAPLFKVTDDPVGSVYRLESVGQQTTYTITAQNQFGSAIRVAGVENTRIFAISITVSGAWAGGTITLQRSIGVEGSWEDVESYTVATAKTYDDGLDNQIIYYRLGVKTGGYVAGTADLDLAYAAGSLVGSARITGWTSTTVVDAVVEQPLGSTTATEMWWEGAWSVHRGYPSAVEIHDGRLWWAGQDQINGSVSDQYYNYDLDVEGDSGTISRNIGKGPVDSINWLLSLAQLAVGAEGSELIAKSSSLDEPLTPSLFSLKSSSSRGSAPVAPLVLDAGGIYVGRGKTRVYELVPDQYYTYSSNELTTLAPSIGEPEIVRLGIQRNPDTRIHCVRSDGKVAIAVFDRPEKTNCWVLYETDGLVEDVVVLPGAIEDVVYYTVLRGSFRCLEKWALESEARGAALTVLADSAVVYSGASTVTITGLDHLEGETVAAWGNTKDLGTYVVASGSITLSEAVTSAVVGLPYTADFKSSKLAVASQYDAPLTQRKTLDHVGLVLADTHAQGLRYGQDFDHLDGLPLVEAGASVDVDSIWTSYDKDSIELNGEWTTDARLCLRAVSPRPCTVLACVLSVTGHDK